MSYTRAEILEHAERIGKSRATLRRRVSQGCNLRDPESVREWVTWNEIRKTNIQRAKEKGRGKEQGGVSGWSYCPSRAGYQGI
jgi:hypothetical protein